MILFVTALSAETEPLISSLNLKQKWRVSQQKFYEGERYSLIETGIGKIASATGLTRALDDLPEVSMTVNLGLCGCANREIPQGRMFVIRSIRDRASGRLHLPDVISKHELPEAELETWEHAVTAQHRDQLRCDLVDMEASGYFEAASMVMQTHNIHCLKIVSDYLDPKPPNKHYASGLIFNNLDRIHHYIDGAGATAQEQQGALDTRDEEELTDIRNRWHLTTTQWRLLRQSLAYAKLSRGVRLSDSPLFRKPSDDSRQRGHLLDELRKELTQG